MHVRNEHLGHGTHLQATLHELVLTPFSSIDDPSASFVSVKSRKEWGEGKGAHNLLSRARARQDTFLVAQGLPADVPRKVTDMVLVIGRGREEEELRVDRRGSVRRRLRSLRYDRLNG